ncbi:MAG: hypothetical protein HKN01_01385 [Acidimicrobiia bacterium]|nr:hypothetical protein [Acidimicrobiia bacterium]
MRYLCERDGKPVYSERHYDNALKYAGQMYDVGIGRAVASLGSAFKRDLISAIEWLENNPPTITMPDGFKFGEGAR